MAAAMTATVSQLAGSVLGTAVADDAWRRTPPAHDGNRLDGNRRVAKARVLIADDDPDIRALVAVAVRKSGHETVGVVSNGQRALAEALATLPDLVILDVSMPLMSGLDVCTELRADPRTEGMRIVLLSAGAHDRAITAGLSAGADRYVSKPFSPSALVQLVTDMVGYAR
jgi:DNA-binding response OmpR family regulator